MRNSWDPYKILNEFNISHAELKTACLSTLPGYRALPWLPEVDADYSVHAHCEYDDIYCEWSGGFVLKIDRLDTEQPPTTINRQVVVASTTTYKGDCPDSFFAPIVENIQALVLETPVIWDPTLCPKCSSDQTTEIDSMGDQHCFHCGHYWHKAQPPMEASLIYLANHSYIALMQRDPGQAGLWHSLISESLAPLGQRRAAREVERCVLRFEKRYTTLKES